MGYYDWIITPDSLSFIKLQVGQRLISWMLMWSRLLPTGKMCSNGVMRKCASKRKSIVFKEWVFPEAGWDKKSNTILSKQCCWKYFKNLFFHIQDGFREAFYFSCQWSVRVIWAHVEVNVWLQSYYRHYISLLHDQLGIALKGRCMYLRPGYSSFTYIVLPPF
jgi:hypothetical protein